MTTAAGVVAALCGLVAVSIVLAQVGLARVGVATLFAGALAAVALAAVRLVRTWGRTSLASARQAAARLAESLAPELGTAASSAVDFSLRLADEQLPFSRELAHEHVERTARALDSVDLVRRYDASRQRDRQRLFALLGGAVLLVLAVAQLLPAGRARLLALLVSPSAAQLVDVPLMADLRVVYRFPAYTGLPPRVVEGGDGSLSAVTGTEVEVSGVADEAVRRAVFRLEDDEGRKTDIPMQVEDGRRLRVSLQLVRDGRYHVMLQGEDGDELEERQRHPIHAVPDASPEIALVAPVGDVELKGADTVELAYDARDDFGVSEVALVVELQGHKEPKRLGIVSGNTAPAEREGKYRWAVAELGLEAGAEGRFYLEATDNDAQSGPKKAVSGSRRITLFSAQKHHEGLLQLQQRVLDGLVDWLAQDLVAPAQDPLAQRKPLEAISKVSADLVTLVPALREDKLSNRQVAQAFSNILEHVQKAGRERQLIVGRLTPAPQDRAVQQLLGREQRRAVEQNEKDIIYLDDLLAVQRIDELKNASKDLLSAQRDLQAMLEKYRQSKDPALRAELEARIRDLKGRMMELLARMAQIKKQLPGEYRNLESATQLAVDDQLQRLEQKLREGDLDAAAAELEELANMIENMSERIERAEEQFGGERYAELRQKMNEFSERFAELEGEQKALAERAKELAKQMREQAVQKAGSSMDDVAKKARDKVAEALRELDTVVVHDNLYDVNEALDRARQRLLDLDSLLAEKDFAEAREIADEALKQEGLLELALGNRLNRYGSETARDLADGAAATNRAEKRTREVAELLDKLFPDADDVLSPKQQQQMKGMAKKQQELERAAQKIAEQMQQLSSEIPLFGGEPKAALDGARAEMGQAQQSLQQGQVPGGAQHGQRAAEQLGQLRQALEQAAKGGGKGGVPLPFAMGGGPGEGRDDGSEGMSNKHEEVHIPGSDKKAAPRYRQDLLEAAKQKAPERYEDAVRRYYEELIR